MVSPSKSNLNSLKHQLLNKLLHYLLNSLLKMKRKNFRRMTIMMRRTTRVNMEKKTSTGKRILSQKRLKSVRVLYNLQKKKYLRYTLSKSRYLRPQKSALILSQDNASMEKHAGNSIIKRSRLK
jgi:hypothetical protein